MSRFLTTLGLILAAIALTSTNTSFAQQSYDEDFTTTTFEDLVNTTADWNTTDGELKLPSFAPSLVGGYDIPGYAWAVAVSGDLAFVAGGSSGLQVIDITDPANPTLVVALPTEGDATGIAVSGDLAILTGGSPNFVVIDITNPADPVPIGLYDTPGDARSVAISGDLAFVADGGFGLRLIDITDPTYPILAGSYDTPGSSYDVAVAGDLAFVADYGAGLQVINITDPANPTPVGNCATQHLAESVAVAGNLAFVADSYFGLQVIDITNPANPFIVGNCITPDRAQGVEVAGNRAFVAGNFAGLQVIDITDPKNPTIVGNCQTPFAATGVAVESNLAFIADGQSGLQVVEISEFVNPVQVGTYETPGRAFGVAVSGDLAVVAEHGSGLQFFDITNPANPIWLSNFDTQDDAWSVAVSGDLVFAAAEDVGGLQVIDIIDPEHPAYVDSYDTPGFATGVTVSGDLAFVADGSSGLRIIDITDPSNLTLAGFYDTPGDARGVVVSGDLAFVADYEGGLQLIDFSDPALPWLVDTYNPPRAAIDVAVSGDLAFLACSEDGLHIVDISNPADLTLVSTYDTPGYRAFGVEVSGDFVFLAADLGGLQVVDISDPGHPYFAGSYETSNSGSNVTISGGLVFLADNLTGLHLVQVFQDEVMAGSNVGQSIAVDGRTDMIMRARLATVETAGVAWELSANAGSSWQPFVQDGEWVEFNAPGDELLWRSKHSWLPGINPTVTNLTLEWLIESAFITDISDVPNDQGRQVRVEWRRSGHDFIDDSSQIVEYAVYRQIDPDLLMELPASASRVASDPPVVAAAHTDMMLAAGWDFVTTVPVLVEDDYAVIVPTLADSTIANGQYHTTFMVTALTATPGVFYRSPPDSGYSVDDLAPGVPQGITASYWSTGVSLSWDDAADEDFQYYRIYRDTYPEFLPSPANLVHEIAASSWTDPATDPWGYHYRITALDHAGNESESGSPSAVTGVWSETVPTRTALLGAVPNPFNPSTKLSFELASPGPTRLNVYDTAGRLVATLVDVNLDSGLHEVIWDGRDKAGRVSSAGVYLYRLEVGEYIETKRMTLIK